MGRGAGRKEIPLREGGNFQERRSLKPTSGDYALAPLKKLARKRRAHCFISSIALSNRSLKPTSGDYALAPLKKTGTKRTCSLLYK